MIAALLDHVWQSSLFALPVAMLALLLRRQPARLRFWLWLAASLKFLLPFSALVLLGRILLPPVAVPAAALAAIRPAVLPFTAAPIAPPVFMLGQIVLLLWAAGSLAVAGRALWRAARMRALAAGAMPLDIAAPVPVKSAASFLEPGLVGIWRPVILLPEGLARNLSGEELDAVLAHEGCHLARRDNLAAAAHMLVEALFWFHPLVWWIGRRLVEERERACDEKVLASGNTPLVYAQSILKVCRFYVRSPLACASGMSGLELDTRLAAIMAGGRPQMRPCAGLLLALAGASALMLPLGAGMLGSLPVTPIAARMERAMAVPLAPLLAPAPQTVAAAPRPTPRPRLTVTAPPATRLAAPALEVSPLPVAATLPELPAPVAVAAPAPLAEDMVCRPPEPLPGSRFSGPTICKLQSEWAALKQKGQQVAADGSIFEASAFERKRSLSGSRPCVFPGGASSGVGALGTCF